MIRQRLRVLDLVGKLLSYPKEGYCQYAVELDELFKEDNHELSEYFSQFLEFVKSKETYEQEELFTRTFEINPGCALEVGWHLFGEEYSRGLFMVRMREELRQNNIAEATELPDHISYVLPILDLMNPTDGREFARACVCPSLGKMKTSLEEIDSPYIPLMTGLVFYLLKEYDLPESCLTPEESKRFDVGEDPLHNYKGSHSSSIPGYSEESCDSGICSGCSGDLISLDSNLPNNLQVQDTNQENTLKTNQQTDKRSENNG